MKKIHKNQVLKWSNLFFLIPLIIAINYNIHWYAIILLLVFIISLDYHFFNEAKSIYYLDVVFSTILIISNLILLFRGNWILPYSLIAVLFAMNALYFYSKKSKSVYYYNHSLWHIFSAGVCIFCLITFLSF